MNDLAPSTIDSQIYTTASAYWPKGGLRCVSSGYPAAGCSCAETLPTSVALAVWARMSARAERRRDGFFRIAWQGRVWLAYGLKNGRVRGVYCPTHTTQRDQRARTQGASAGAATLGLAA